MQRVQPTTSQLNELQQEAFDILLGTVNARHRTGLEHLSSSSQNIPVVGKAYFEDELTEEATWGSHHPHHVCFASGQKWVWHLQPWSLQWKLGKITPWSLNRKEPEKALWILQCVHPDTKCGWPCKNSAKCMNQRSTSWRVGILPQQI